MLTHDTAAQKPDTPVSPPAGTPDGSQQKPDGGSPPSDGQRPPGSLRDEVIRSRAELNKFIEALPAGSKAELAASRKRIFDASVAFNKATEKHEALAGVRDRRNQALREFQATAPANQEEASRKVSKTLGELDAETAKIVAVTLELEQLRKAAEEARAAHQAVLDRVVGATPEGKALLEKARDLEKKLRR